MPTISCGFREVPERSRRTLLTDLGPTIDVQIGHDPGFEDFTNEKPLIPPDLYPALVDTGASGNSVDTQLAAQLRLPVYEYNVLISGSVGEHTTNIYLAQIYIPGRTYALGSKNPSFRRKPESRDFVVNQSTTILTISIAGFPLSRERRRLISPTA